MRALELTHRLLKRAANSMTLPFNQGWQAGPLQPWHAPKLTTMSNLLNPMPGGMVANPAKNPGYLTPGVQESLNIQRQLPQAQQTLAQLRQRGAGQDLAAGRAPLDPDYQAPASPPIAPRTESIVRPAGAPRLS